MRKKRSPAVAAALHRGRRTWQCYRRGVTGALNVLVVDDDPGIREMLGLALREARFEVVLSDGRELQDPGPADVILLDVRLRGRSGLDLLADAPSLARVPIIVMTAGADVDIGSPALAGVAGFVSKPFDLDVLEQTIRDVVGRSRQPG